MAVGPQDVPAGRRAAGIETRGLGDQHVGPVRMPSRGDEVFRLGDFRPGAAHVHRAGVGQSGRRPRHRAGKDEVDLAGRVPEAERLQGAAVARREPALRQAQQPGWRHVQQRGPDRRQLRERCDPGRRFPPPRHALRCPRSCACAIAAEPPRGTGQPTVWARVAQHQPGAGGAGVGAAAPPHARRRRSAARAPGPAWNLAPTAASPVRGPGGRTGRPPPGRAGIRRSWFRVRSATPSARRTSGAMSWRKAAPSRPSPATVRSRER